MGSGGIAPRILNLGEEWPASRSGRFTSGARAPVANWVGDWVGPQSWYRRCGERRMSAINVNERLLLIDIYLATLSQIHRVDEEDKCEWWLGQFKVMFQHLHGGTAQHHENAGRLDGLWTETLTHISRIWNKCANQWTATSGVIGVKLIATLMWGKSLGHKKFQTFYSTSFAINIM
jgi:hypothetical protein